MGTKFFFQYQKSPNIFLFDEWLERNQILKGVSYFLCGYYVLLQRIKYIFYFILSCIVFKCTSLREKYMPLCNTIHLILQSNTFSFTKIFQPMLGNLKDRTLILMDSYILKLNSRYLVWAFGLSEPSVWITDTADVNQNLASRTKQIYNSSYFALLP